MTGDVRIDPVAGLPAYRPRQAEKQAPCQAGCASGGDTRGWIGVVSQRYQRGLSNHEAFAEAWRIIVDVNPFPAVLGRICPHPCETNCNRQGKDAPVAINALERFLGDWAIEAGLGLPESDRSEHVESIGVVGAGPSGLSFAYQMARRGYDVVVYERAPQAGGMLRYGVPDYRLPPSVLDAEIARIVDLGVKIQTGTAIADEASMADLRDRHDIIYLGLGAQAGQALGIPGEDGPGVWSGVEFLAKANRGETVDVGGRAIVIGGGNTAVDAARVARRAGAEVTIAYRRTEAEMPAIPSEIREAVNEGVNVEFLVAPSAVIRDETGVTGLSMFRMALGEPGPDGRRTPVPVHDSGFDLEADSIIVAVSQQPDPADLAGLGITGRLAGGVGEIATGLWAGGDLLELDIAGTAISHGRRAAEAVHAKLRGLPIEPVASARTIAAGEINLDFLDDRPRVSAGHLTAEEALARPDAEVAHTISEEQFLAEIERCFSCGLCLGCQACWMYCTPGSFARVASPGAGMYFTMTLDACEECGKCIEVCPCGYLEAI